MGSTSEKIRERRLDRMRAGQAVCEYVVLVSDREIRVPIVPLTEAEYNQVLEAIAALGGQDDVSNLTLKDRRISEEILLRSIREESDLSERMFGTLDEMLEILEVADIDEIFDRYNEMMDKSSPAMDAIPEHELDEIKKDLQTMDWNALSGPAWYALKRFLSKIMPTPLRDK